MVSRRRAWIALVLVLASSAPYVSRSRADAILVDRIVAVVGDRPIALSELRARLRPFLATVVKKGNAHDQWEAETEAQRNMLDRMIDERIEAREAARLAITVTAEDTEAAVAAVAAQNKLSIPEIFREAKAQGMDEAQYREELTRQVLSAKLARKRKETTHTTSVDGDAERAAWLKEERSRINIEIRL